jgi:serine/threonine protein kinase
VLRVNSYGSITHMAPEVLGHKLVSRAADVYALGVLLWQVRGRRQARGGGGAPAGGQAGDGSMVARSMVSRMAGDGLGISLGSQVRAAVW